MTRMRIGTAVPSTLSTRSAKIRVGKAIMMSTDRLSAWSTQPPRVAARNPQGTPTAKDSAVVAIAMAMVLRAP